MTNSRRDSRRGRRTEGALVYRQVELSFTVLDPSPTSYWNLVSLLRLLVVQSFRG
jgi:hypothetical protein